MRPHGPNGRGRRRIALTVRDEGRWREPEAPTQFRGHGLAIIRACADEFRIDRVAVGWSVRRLEQRAIPIARVVGSDGRRRDDVVRMLARADDRELETHPGDRLSAEFDVGRAAPGTRTYLLAAQGYYIEWVRGSWMRAATDSTPFSPARTPVRDVLRSWRASKDTLEQKFFRQRVPVA